MTREIALHCMKSYSELHSDLCELCPIYGQTGSDHCFEDALEYVIKDLEQKPIIDKVRAQIWDLFKGLEMSLAILEKGDKLEPKLKGAIDAVEECINIIDEAKSEAEKEV